jgi:hypothetical protein
MRLGELFTFLWIYDKSRKFDEMHEAITAPARQAARAAELERAAIKRAVAEEAESRRQQERLRKREEGAHKLKRYCDGKPFRIFSNNAVGTTSMWLQGRKIFAETYSDGRRKGYAVYEGLYLDMRIYTIEEFNARFSRWVESSDTPVPPHPVNSVADSVGQQREPSFRPHHRGEASPANATASAAKQVDSNYLQNDLAMAHTPHLAPTGPIYAISEIQKMVDFVNQCITGPQHRGEMANQTNVAQARPPDPSKDPDARLNSSANPHERYDPDKTVEFPAVREQTQPPPIRSRINGEPPPLQSESNWRSVAVEIPSIRVPPVVVTLCPSCNVAVVDGNHFCGNCGAQV